MGTESLRGRVFHSQTDMVKNWIIRIACCTLLLMTVVCAGCTGDKVLATVNGVKVLQSDVDAMVKSMEKKYTSYGISEEEFYGDEASKKALYDGVLEALVDQKLVLYLADRMGMEPLSEDERKALMEEGNAELYAMKLAAEKREDVTLSDMLDFFGCTEENYVDNYVSGKEYNICYKFLSDLAEITDADKQAYYDRMYEQQKRASADTPKYLGNYAEEGTILYYPEGAVYAEYIVVDDTSVIDADYEALLKEYGDKAETDTAVIYPGTSQFSEETVKQITGLKPGETSGVLKDGEKHYVFRLLESPVIPVDWTELPEALLNSLKENVGSEYVNSLIQGARDEGIVSYK